jgi:hypothetical protein
LFYKKLLLSIKFAHKITEGGAGLETEGLYCLWDCTKFGNDENVFSINDCKVYVEVRVVDQVGNSLFFIEFPVPSNYEGQLNRCWVRKEKLSNFSWKPRPY